VQSCRGESQEGEAGSEGTSRRTSIYHQVSPLLTVLLLSQSVDVEFVVSQNSQRASRWSSRTTATSRSTRSSFASTNTTTTMIPYFYPYQSVSFVFLCSVFLLITILLSLRMSYLLLSHDNDRDSVAQFSKTRVREFALKVQVGNNIKRGKYYKEQREVTSFSLCL